MSVCLYDGGMMSAATAWRNVATRATACRCLRGGSGQALACVAAACLLLLSACETPPTVATDEPEPVLDVPVEHVTYGKPQVTWVGDVVPSVVFGRPIIEPASDEQAMRVTQPVSTTSSRSVILAYRFQFFDAQGTVLASADPEWQLLMLTGGTPVFLEGRSANNLAHDYRIELKARGTQR
jgi:hypothetical protein